MAICESCGRDLEEVAPYTRPRNGEGHGEPVTLQLCPLCYAATPDTAQVSRKEMLRVRDLADRRMEATSLYRGQRIIGYRKSMGGDNRWRPRVCSRMGPASSSTSRRRD
jgi:hypothetical protein